MTGGAFLSRSQSEVGATIRRGLARPDAVIAVSGEAGLGKSTVVASVLREVAGTTWTVTPPSDDVVGMIRLLQGRAAVSPFTGVFVIEDAHELKLPALVELFATLARDRASLPRIVLVTQPAFWTLLEHPALAGCRERIDAIAVLFPMSLDESERYVADVFQGVVPEGARGMLQALILGAQGNPGRLSAQLAAFRPHRPQTPPADRGRPDPPAGMSRDVAATPARASGRLVPATLALATLAMAVVASASPFLDFQLGLDGNARRASPDAASATPLSAPTSGVQASARGADAIARPLGPTPPAGTRSPELADWLFQRGKLALQGGDPATARVLFRRAASIGNAPAAAALARGDDAAMGGTPVDAPAMGRGRDPLSGE